MIESNDKIAHRNNIFLNFYPPLTDGTNNPVKRHPTSPENTRDAIT